MVQRPNNTAEGHCPSNDSEGNPFAKARELERGLYVAAEHNRRKNKT